MFTDMWFSSDPDDHDGAPIMESNEGWLAITSDVHSSLCYDQSGSDFVWRDSVDEKGGAFVLKPNPLRVEIFSM